MNILVCVKRVPDLGSAPVLRPGGDGPPVDIETDGLGFTLSAHDEAALEVAVQLAEETDGEVTVVSLGTEDAEEQVRYALSVGAAAGVLVTVPEDSAPGAPVPGGPVSYGPADVAAELARVARGGAADDGPAVGTDGTGCRFDLVLLGNDAPDSGDFQVPVRLAELLDLPVLTGISTLSAVSEGESPAVEARGPGPSGTEVYEVSLPAVVAVQEGGVSPRYPSIPGRMRAKKAEVAELRAAPPARGSGRVSLRVPAVPATQVEILGEGPEAAPALVDVLEKIGVI